MLLADFHPACQNWFNASFASPTDAQVQAWSAIKEGRHTLISAPTGSGKTLAAFFAAIDNLVQQGLETGVPKGVQILYVSPLKALSNDIRRNLEAPLDGIAEHLHLAGCPPVNITAAVRTGDTPQSERQKMAKTPPNILVTTPESLYFLLTSASGRAMLSHVQSVIVDEIHAMLGDKRGSHLALSIERLESLLKTNNGVNNSVKILQRIGLSATQKPIEMVAKFLVGNSNSREAQTNCKIVDAGFRRNIDVALEVPDSPLSGLMSNEIWEELYHRLIDLIQSHDTTLVFVNTRRLSERLALALSERLGEHTVCSHHGSMSKDLRHQAEQKLKSGDLKVLVATASMELGIDIGSVDLVVQFSSPKSIATFLQRVGRSGHSIDGTPKGILFPLSRDDLVECTALLNSIVGGELDRIVMPEKPLDILAQQIVAEVSSRALKDSDSAEGWDLDELYALFGNAYPYRELEAAEFKDIVKMLADGYTTRRGRRGSHLHLDAINNRLRARRGANLVALTNGGAIPDMFDYQVVLDPEDIVVGSLNEDFALEALPGDIFTLGSHSWQLLRIDGLKVRVRDAQGMQPTIPFWFGEGLGRTRELSESVSNLRTVIGEKLIQESVEGATAWVVEQIGLPQAGASQLVEYLHAGMSALGVMPSRETLVMERFFDEVGDMHVVIHSPFGSRINRGWGLALRKRFCRAFNFELQAAANEDSIVISLGSVHSFALDEVFNYLQTASLEDVLVQALLDAPMFEVRWRWNATRSLAIQRNRSGKRVPPQFQRMDAEDLVAHIFPDQIACFENIKGNREIPDHPLVKQTLHDCLTEAMDIDELMELIGAIEGKQLNLVAKDLREPSPFAQEIINARPYAFLDDAPFEERRTNAIRNRSWVDAAEAKSFSILDINAIQQVRDEAWPYVRNAEELHDALLSIAYITDEEFIRCGFGQWQEQLCNAGRLCRFDHLDKSLWIATEKLPCFRSLFDSDGPAMELPEFLLQEQWEKEDALREIVRGRLTGMGPLTVDVFTGELGVETAAVNLALIALEVEGFAFQGHFTPANSSLDKGAGPEAIEWCERRLLQRIHRYTIDAHRKSIKPVSLQTYTQFLMDLHHVLPVPGLGPETSHTPTLDGQTQLQNSLNLMDGFVAPAAAWESDIFPLRIKDYDPNWLDVMCVSGKLVWGRYSLPSTSQSIAGKGGKAKKRAAGPVKNTPITLICRSNLDIWQALASAQYAEDEERALSGVAEIIQLDLGQNGASFFHDIQSRTGLLKTQIEQSLAELVSAGCVTSDSFTGLRALLTPSDRKPGVRRRRGRKAMFGVEDAGRWSLLKSNKQGCEPVAQNSRHWDLLDEEQLERLVSIYLQRWGVLFRSVLDRETFAPPWRVLLGCLRKMELRGALRGGRFISGVGGEQFAFSETVDALRKLHNASGNSGKYYSLAAADPVNLLNLVQSNKKLPRKLKNRVLYQDGVPIAVLDAGEVKFLKEIGVDEQWSLQQALLKRNFPVRLRSYLGT
jgi:ATP-dependent Lhr-like helicase